MSATLVFLIGLTMAQYQDTPDLFADGLVSDDVFAEDPYEEIVGPGETLPVPPEPGPAHETLQVPDAFADEPVIHEGTPGLPYDQVLGDYGTLSGPAGFTPVGPEPLITHGEVIGDCDYCDTWAVPPWRKCWGIWGSTYDMPQHFAYYPAYHGYYYFRPYNYVHVLQHQEIAPLLGGDWRAPYATGMFQQWYDELLGEDTLDDDFADYLKSKRLETLSRISAPLPRLEDLVNPPDEPTDAEE